VWLAAIGVVIVLLDLVVVDVARWLSNLWGSDHVGSRAL
jgi:hypothetical protein